MTEPNQEFDFDNYDPYAVRIGVPTASWKFARPGEGFTGIILPQKNRKGNEVAYVLGQRQNMQGEKLFWDNGRPQIQQDILLGEVRDLRTGGAVAIGDWMSQKAKDRFDEVMQSGDPTAMKIVNSVIDFQLRRQIIKGESLDKGMRAAVGALAATLGPAPVIGARISYKLEKLEENEHGGDTKIYLIEYKAPDPESLAFVARYKATLPQDGADPYARGGVDVKPASAQAGPPKAAQQEDDEPPF